MTRFCLFTRIWKIFQNLKNQKPQTYWNSSHESYLLVKSLFYVFWTSKKTCNFEGPKNIKNAILRVRMIHMMIHCNKFEVSDFWNFQKIFKIRLKKQKRVIFTTIMFSCLQYLVTGNKQFLYCVKSKPLQLSQSKANFYTLH